MQYKSAVWYHNEAQKAAVQAMVAKLEAKYGKLATTVDPAKEWHDAEVSERRCRKARRHAPAGGP